MLSFEKYNFIRSPTHAGWIKMWASQIKILGCPKMYSIYSNEKGSSF